MNFMKGLLGNHIKWQHRSIHQLCSTLILRLCSQVICSVLTFHGHHFQAMSFALVSDISAVPESTRLLVIKFFQKKIFTRNTLLGSSNLRSYETWDIKSCAYTSKYKKSWGGKAERKTVIPRIQKFDNFRFRNETVQFHSTNSLANLSSI